MPIRYVDKDKQDALIEKLRLLVFKESNTVTLYYLDNNKELQENIMNMKHDFRKEFFLHQETSIQRPEALKRPWLSLIKSFIGKKYSIIIEDYTDKESKVRTKRYHIQPKTT
jgi:hypothetical protein